MLLSRFIIALYLLFSVCLSVQAEEKVKSIRVWKAPEYTRVVFDLTGAVDHQVFMLKGPDRLVLDLSNTVTPKSLSNLDFSGSPINGIRHAKRAQGDVRFVLDLKESVKPKSFLLKPNDHYGDRLVVDVYPYSKSAPQREVVQSAKSIVANGKRDIIVTIDAGHGGEDPGAIGPGRLMEKNVVLSIAQELKREIDALDGFKAQLTREGDYYISLRGRTRLARKQKADLFVSIHADAFHKKSARGASVWALSERGATSEMGRWLAQKENDADLIGGVGNVSLDDKSDVLKEVLLDLSMTSSLKSSLDVGSLVLGEMGQVAKLHKKHVEQAGFVVLKSPDIPSILVETGFISNPTEAKNLGSLNYRKKMAKRLAQGVKRYFNDKPPVGTYLAWVKAGRPSLEKTQASSGLRLENAKSQTISRAPSPTQSTGAVTKYKVQHGDSLSRVARKFSVTVNELKEINGLKSSIIHVGQTLKVPGGKS
ncbi:N-acetylmuramoyl-L-alanine amidase [Litoribrevibacter albus]|uniref:N-acetylmuramoyl-L-alanine amidase AmiC n=1 Tax=Litoribrevibacter albus TaxID=1473156 RepID=A0AA37S9F9_9GAMM|nr:N-acetylmuramoyl-L-alanine amidase [Litoribrevibacter albus]GLQ30631.1 N-acetylmuramoyl-L-alanine amidase [Litoribrevibacter albus]